MELEKISLKDKQEIQGINLNPGDNGGCSLRYTVYTPSMKHSDSTYEEHNEIFGAEEVDMALERIKELYKANLQSKGGYGGMAMKGMPEMD